MNVSPQAVSARQWSECAWTQHATCDDVAVGAVVLAKIDGDAGAPDAAAEGTDSEPSLVTLCPDPLSYALAAGLPRPALLDKAFEGRSTWTERGAVVSGQVTAVCQFTEYATTVLGDGDGVARLVFTVAFYRRNGTPLGSAQAERLCHTVAT